MSESPATYVPENWRAQAWAWKFGRMPDSGIPKPKELTAEQKLGKIVEELYEEVLNPYCDEKPVPSREELLSLAIKKYGCSEELAAKYVDRLQTARRVDLLEMGYVIPEPKTQDKSGTKSHF